MYTELFKESVDIVLGSQKNSQKEAEPACALEVAFKYPEFMKRFQDLIAPIAPNLKEYGDRLICFYPSESLAQEASSKIRDVLHQFRETLLKQPFNPDWLVDYLVLKDFGVNWTSPNRHLQSAKQIATYIEEKRKDLSKSDDYQTKLDAARKYVVDYKISDMAENFQAFFDANFDGVQEGIAEELFKIMEQETEGQYHLSNYASQEIMQAMGRKAGAMTEDSVSALMTMMSAEEQLKKLRTTSIHDEWKSLAKKLDLHIYRTCKNISMHGLDDLLKDEDTKPAAIEPFKGPDLSYDMEIDMNQRLSPRKLRYDIQEQGCRLPMQIAGAVAAYYLTMKEYKHEMEFERMLTEHSKVMDKKPFFDHLLQIAADSRPLPELNDNPLTLN